MSGGPSQPPGTAASPPGERRPEEEGLGTEESLSRGSGMDPSPAAEATAGAGSTSLPMAVVTPPGSSGAEGGASGGAGGAPPDSGGPQAEPSTGAAPNEFLLPPVPRRPPSPPRWVAPGTPPELPAGALRDVFMAIPAERRVDAWLRRGRRLTMQAPLPSGVECDLPALLAVEDGPEVSALHGFLSSASGEKEVDDISPVVGREWCVLPPPYLGGKDAHLHHAKVREEFRLQLTFEYPVHGARGEFSQVPQDIRGEHNPTTPGWWSEVEVPCGFPARMPQVVAYFGSHLRRSMEGHRVYACLATHWVVEVTRAWHSDVIHRGYLWHLSPTLVGGTTTLSSEWLATGADFGARRILEAMKTLHNQLRWEDLAPNLRRTKRAAPGVETDPPRDFVHCTKGVVRGCLRPREGLGSAELPYAVGVTASTPAPASVWDNPSHPGLARREPRRVTPRNRDRASAPTGVRGTLPVFPAARASLICSLSFSSPFPSLWRPGCGAGIRSRPTWLGI